MTHDAAKPEGGAGEPATGWPAAAEVSDARG